MLIINTATNSFRKFTLTSGYDNTNTKFVRVSDGYSVGADPLHLNKGGQLRPHHVKYEGFLYGCRKGYVLATQKGGYQGWSDLVEVATKTYKCFNPFEGRTLELQLDGLTLTINDGKGKTATNIGKFATIFGEVEVIATPFKGLRNFMRLIRRLPEWATVHVNNLSYNEEMTFKYDMGVVTKGQFDPLETFNLHTVEYCVVDESNTLVKVDGRYFALQNDRYCHSDCDFLNERGILTLTQAGSHYPDTAQIPANSEYETTEKWWNHYTADKKIATGRAYLHYKPEEIRPLHVVEAAMLNNLSGEACDYTVMQYVKESLGLGDERHTVVYRDNTHTDCNVKAIYSALLSTLTAQMLCNLIAMPYTVECLNWHYEFEKPRLLGTFLHACMENGKDMESLWLNVITLQPQSMTDWLNANLVYWVEERHVGYHFSNNPAWVEKRNYQGVYYKYIFAENASCAAYKPSEVSEEEYGVLALRLAAERAYKARYDAVPL